MGTSLSNMHLFVEAFPRAEHYERVKTLVEAAMQQQGFTSTTPENAERSIVVAFEENSSWISIYQGDSLKRIPAMANKLSQEGYPVIEVEVHDSDVLQMKLFSAGREIDTFSDWANYESYPRKRSGDPVSWANALPAVPSAAQLQVAWKPQGKDDPFASEGTLYRVMDLLKIDRWRLWLGENHEGKPATGQVTELHFHYAQTHPYDKQAVGLPVFRKSAYATEKQLYLRRRSDPDIVFSVTNLGGAGMGIEIELQGDVLDKAFVEPVGLIAEPPYNSWNGKFAAFPVKQTDAVGKTIYRYELEAQSIPAGLADWAAVYALPAHLRDFNREFHLQHAGGMFVLVLKPLQPGTGQLFIRIIPLDNPNGRVELPMTVDVIG